MPAPESVPDTPILEYSLRPPLAWLGRHRRQLVWSALLVSVAALVFWQWPTIKQQALWRYWARRCAAHVMPTSGPLIETDPVKAAQLIAANPDYVSWRPSQSRSHAVYSPLVWREYCRYDGRTAWGSSWKVGESQPITFLGERRRPDGQRRLVAIKGACTNALDLLAFINVQVLPPPGLAESVPKPVMNGGFMYSGRWHAAMLHPAQADPRDPTHITIQFDVEDLFPESGSRKVIGTGTLDGYLTNNDSMRFTLRDQPEPVRLVRFGRTEMRGTVPTALDRSPEEWMKMLLTPPTTSRVGK